MTSPSPSLLAEPAPAAGTSSITYQAAWIAGLSLQYGYHISCLNGLLPSMNAAFNHPSVYQWSSVVSAYTLGGLLGSMVAGSLADRFGRKRTSTIASAFVGIGALLMAFAAPHVYFLVSGRLLIGLGCGISVVVVPTYLNEIAPPDRKGSIGVLNQLGIVTGIFVGQTSSLALATSQTWSYVFLISAALAGVHVIAGSKANESPIWLAGASAGNTIGETAPLLDEEGGEAAGALQSQAPPKTILGVFRSPLTRKGLRIVLLTQIVQQASGINAVLYYSTDILGTVLHGRAGYVALMITAVNFVMTFPPMYLIERLGRRPLLLASIAGMCVSALLLSLTVDSHAVMASICTMAFVAAFSIGLGPVPFILIPEVVPAQSAATVASIGLSCNWITNYLVAAFFPILNFKLGTSSSIMVFAVITGLATITVSAIYKA